LLNSTIANFTDHICCPKCYSTLLVIKKQYICQSNKCNASYPIVDGKPIIIDENKSIFKIDTFINKEDTTFIGDDIGWLKNISKFFTPSMNANYVSGKILEEFYDKIIKRENIKNVLIIGGSIAGYGIDNFTKLNQTTNVISTDVSFGPKVDLICDGHCLPFKNNSIDAVIIQAVLEHVIDPYECVNEICRVLRVNGYVLSEVPFMQQLHQAPYDFTRFTHIGHRWLFKKFDHIDSGVVCGTGMALSWSIRGFFSTMINNEIISKILVKIAHILFFWIKYFDKRNISTKKQFENASAIYFIGRLSDKSISFDDLREYYESNGI